MHFHLFPFLKDEISVTNVWHNTPTHSGHNKYENLYSFWLWGKVKTRTMHNRYYCALSFIFIQCSIHIIVPCHSFSSSVPYILLCPVIYFFQCSIHIIVPCHSFSSSVPYILVCPVIHFLPVFHTYYCALSFTFFQCSIHIIVPCHSFSSSVPYIQLCPVIHFLPVFHTFLCYCMALFE